MLNNQPVAHVFDIHRLGLLAVHSPRLILSIVIVSTMLCLAVSVPWLRFEGEPSKIFDGSSQEYQTFEDFERNFHAYSKDEILVVESPQLTTVTGIENLRELHFDLQLTPGIGDVVSIFSVAQYIEDARQWATVLPASFDNSEQVKDALTDLYQQHTLARSLLTKKLDSTVIIFSPVKQDAESEDASQTYDIAELDEILQSYQNSSFKLELAGESIIERELVELVKQDTVIITLLGIFFAMFIAYLMFASISAVAVCVTPLVVALIWYLGAISILGITIDVATVVIPVLIIILSFADNVHLFLNWRRKVASGMDPKAAIENSVISIGPAIALASTTTGVAFFVLMVASSTLLDRMAVSGLLGVLAIFLSVILVGPLSILLIASPRPLRISGGEKMLGLGGGFAAALYQWKPRLGFIAALVMLVPLLLVHYYIPGQFSLLDYLPKTSVARSADQKVEALFGGADQLILKLKRQSRETTILEPEIAKLRLLEEMTKEALGSKTAISIASFQLPGSGVSKDANLESVLSASSLQRFISKDLAYLTVTAPVPISANSDRLNGQIERLREVIRRQLPDSEIEITGSSQMKSSVGPKLIEELRLGLLLSVVISMLVIGLSFRSWKVGLACLIPNVLPILAIELFIWFTLGRMDISLTIALMIGFGLAVDDTIHFVNHYVAERNNAATDREASVDTLKLVGPALVATTVIIGMGLCTTAFASLPSVFTFAAAVAGVLVFALVADMWVLPSALYVLDRLRRRHVQDHQ